MPSLNFAPRVPVFDANVRVGDTPGVLSPSPTRADLLAELDRHGVERAIIYHAQSELRSPTEGNRRLEEWIGDDSRLMPQWTILPTAGSMQQIEDLHAAGRVQSVRLYDVRHAELPFPPARLPRRFWTAPGPPPSTSTILSATCTSCKSTSPRWWESPTAGRPR